MSRSYSPPPERDALGPIDRIEELLGECLAEPEPQWDAAIQRLCAENPGDATALRRRFAALQQAGLAPARGERTSDLALVRALAQKEPEVAAALAEAAGIDPGNVPGMPEARDRRVGTTIAERYTLLDRLGAGAMGVVYRARDEDLGREVAIKLLDAGRFPDAKAEARFLQEAELLAALRHDAIVTLFDRGRSEAGELYLVMELLDGVPLTAVLEAAQERAPGDGLGTLAALLGKRALRDSSFVRVIARWGAELAQGLAAAHHAGILHRDIKPSNVFVRSDGRAVLLDFGIATRGGDLTAAGTVLGTPWYMAPEQAIPGSKLTPALDVYGLCSCLYHLLTGRAPFDGDPLEVLARIAHDDPPSLSALRPELPRDLRAIVETGMARLARDRYATADLLAADLLAFLDHRPVQARPLSRVGRLWRSARRRPARAGLAAAAGAIVALGAGYLALHVRERARADREEKVELMVRLPESLAFEGHPEQRLLEILRPEHRALLRQLDRIVELDPTDLPPRLWRAALRLDEGEHAAAAQDLADAARHAPTAYLREVAGRYQRAARERRGTRAIDLDNLSAVPSTPADCFVAGFHELRNRHVAGFARRADDLLARAAADYPPARDLRLLALVARGEAEDPRFFSAAIDESLALEGLYGRGTARTYAIRGAALVGLGRNVEALKPLGQALALRPDRHSPLQNLAVAYRALGDKQKAREFVEQAYAVRPHFWNTTYLRAQILMDKGEFAQASAVAATLNEGEGPDAMPKELAWRKPFLLATIATEHLSSLYLARGPRTELEAQATRALAHLDAACARAPGGFKGRANNRRALVQALQRGDDTEACICLLRHLSEIPEDNTALKAVAVLLPKAEASARLTAHLSLLLATQAHRRAPQEDIEFMQALDAARNHVKQVELQGDAK